MLYERMETASIILELSDVVAGRRDADRFLLAEVVRRLHWMREADAGDLLTRKTAAIPVSAARGVALKYGWDQIVVMARKVGEGGLEHVTTWGASPRHCEVAEAMGNQLKQVMQWPEADVTWKARKTGFERLLRDALAYEREAFEADEEVNGADLVEWFAEWRKRAERAVK